MPALRVVEDVFSKAACCRVCFEPVRNLGVRSALIDLAQPRWVGPNYEANNVRVLVVMLNPGSGASRPEKNTEFRDALRRARDDVQHLTAVMEFMREDMFDWGRGRFIDFIHACGVRLDDVALANIAWCATAGDKYPSGMLKTCFDLHTGQLIKGLDPTAVVLAGSSVWPFAQHVATLLPGARVIKTIHYANRGSSAERSAELGRVRSEIGSAGAPRR
jgi:hypothetical protein